MAGKYNIIIEQGATWGLTLQWQDSEGVVIPLDGYSARMQIRRMIDQPVDVELTTENGRITIADNCINLHLTASDTSELNKEFYVYDLELVNGDVVHRFIEGDIKVSPEVTK